MRAHDPYECPSVFWYEFDPKARVFCDHRKKGAAEAEVLHRLVTEKILKAFPAARNLTACDPKVQQLATRFVEEVTQ